MTQSPIPPRTDMGPSQDRALTYGRIRQDALALAEGLRSMGLDPNELHVLPPTPSCPRPEIAPVVLIQLPNCLAFAPILTGVFASGLTATLVSPALTSSEIGWILQNARPRVIITAQACLAAMREAIGQQKDVPFFSRIPIFTVDVPRDEYPLPPAKGPSAEAGTSDWRQLLAPASKVPARRAPPFPPQSAHTRTAVILWSSGTSGRSKGVLLSHHALNWNCAALWHDADFYRGQAQRWLGYVPFYHVFGLCTIMLLAICTGSTVYTFPSFSLEAVLAAVPRRRITYLHMAPPVGVMLAKAASVEPYAERGDFRSVVAGLTGGAPLGHEVIVAVHRRLGFRIRMGYGLSETCSTSLQRGLTEDDLHAQAGDSGLPHYGVEIMIAADEGGDDAGGSTTTTTTTSATTKAAPINTPGEILVRSPGVMSAYLPFGGLEPGAKPDVSTSLEALTPDGWFRTGDVGTMDAGGQLRITDRLKELIKVRAYQVAPAELEAVLCSLDTVADAGVVGVYDEAEATEWPRAYVVARRQGASEAELRALAGEIKKFTESRAARYKWLVGGIVFVDQIPKSPSGKILRRVLKSGAVKGYEVSVYERKKRDSKL